MMSSKSINLQLQPQLQEEKNSSLRTLNKINQSIKIKTINWILNEMQKYNIFKLKSLLNTTVNSCKALTEIAGIQRRNCKRDNSRFMSITIKS